jgi:hypothetical protein
MLRMLNRSFMKRITILISLFLLLGSTIPFMHDSRIARAGTSELVDNYLPIVWKNFPWSSPFGIEAVHPLYSESPNFSKATDLPTKWIRLNKRISWRQLQPNEGDPIQWDLLSDFENELRAFKAFNIIPIVVVNDYPAWATATRPNEDPSYCGPMLAEKFDAFADFVSQLVNRYKAREFNVHIWELGNEPDIDGTVYNLPIDSEYGCWGNASDPYYGGEHYGDMLKVVTPAIKAVDPLAQVWVGGLLLNSPNTVNPGEGRPELFLEGILEAGTGSDYSYFDGVPYHTYAIYTGLDVDYDNNFPDSPWFGEPWGGDIKGKARFLREIMVAYGVQKPVFDDEIDLGCPPEYYPSICYEPDETFFQMQANYLVRVEVRGVSEGVMGLIWYSLEDPGWRNGGLLDSSGDPHPSYYAYQQLVLQLMNSDYLTSVDYGPEFEAYAFRRDGRDVHVVWTKEDVTGLTILVPATNLIEVHSRDGALISPVFVDGNYQIPVGFSPVYIIRTP